MGLIEQIGKLFLGRRPASQATTADPEERPAAASPAWHGGGGSLSQRFAADAARVDVVRACRDMYRLDPRARGVIKGVSRDAVKGGFRVRVRNNARAEAVAEALVARLRLFSRLDDWARLTFRDGDSFLEVAVSAERQIVDVTRKPTLQMHRASNSADRFDDPSRAYWYAEELWNGMQPPVDALWFADWQIIHARWDHDEDTRYGSPMFASATSAYKRMKEGENDVAVRRKTRAGMRYLHSLDGASEADLLAYQEKNREAFASTGIADFFANKKASISTVQGDANLGQIEDVLHHIRTWWTASPMPMSLLGYGQDLNRDVLQEQKDQYDQAIEQITQWVEDEIVRPLLEREWLLAGILPDGLEIKIEWASKRPLRAADLRDVADAAMRLSALPFMTEEAVIGVLQKFLPGVDLSGIVPSAGASDSARIADTADRLRGEL